MDLQWYVLHNSSNYIENLHHSNIILKNLPWLQMIFMKISEWSFKTDVR